MGVQSAARVTRSLERRRVLAPAGLFLMVLEGLIGTLAYVLALSLRFLDEGIIPSTYLARAIPWAALAFVIHAAAGALSGRLRRPRALLAGHPILPFFIAGLVAVLVAFGVNYLVLPLAWRLPLSVIVVGPMLASAAGSAVRIAATPGPPDIEALLPRPVVELDIEACAPALRSKRVLITGAAGSIGSEIGRQLLRVQPAALTLLDVNESGLFDLEAELRSLASSTPLSLSIADVTDAAGLARLFTSERPQVVFHAAAYKHVPLLEDHPERGFLSNVVGTLNVLNAAVAAEAERVVVISTDKAVNPSSVMGLTKRVAELTAAAIAERQTATAVSVVRFGNVLGSRGSVVPTLLRQIESGQPITITDPEVRRFFMTTAEAASLVLRSAAFGDHGALYVLEMGHEIRIKDLAERLVRMKGLTPGRDVRIEYIGLRPGEKLTEELVGPGETMLPTEHPFVRKVSGPHTDANRLLPAIESLERRRSSGRLTAAEVPPALRELIADAVGTLR